MAILSKEFRATGREPYAAVLREKLNYTKYRVIKFFRNLDKKFGDKHVNGKVQPLHTHTPWYSAEPPSNTPRPPTISTDMWQRAVHTHFPGVIDNTRQNNNPRVANGGDGTERRAFDIFGPH